ncbi:MAG: tRNA pseudouridine(38-40) synthase TruA [Muribaculaceae bacterium]|nr:tRNA pseudouridine(38-40) synthase TruA [Bacteroides sp.]MDE6058282.1 tRNA pseudouridine(38-40) synthase TruA [Muribaculaceae bacterium]
MGRYFLRLAYRGAPFHGWQVQPNAVSVQGEVEKAMSVVLRTPISVVGAGRTDTGVNARTMYAHFDFEGELPEKGRLLVSLNRLLGRDIAVHDIIPVHAGAHARFDASERSYKYFVSFEKTPFFYPLSWHCPNGLDITLMNEAARLLLDTADFTSFAKLHSDAKTNICKVTKAEWSLEGESIAVFSITADRFLRNMVRAIVGTLIDVGRGKLSLEGFRRIIERKDRCAAGQSMPGEALFLWDVKYDYIK